MQLPFTLMEIELRNVHMLRSIVFYSCCCWCVSVFSQESPPESANAASGFGEKVGRGFSDSQRTFDEPGFDLDIDKEADRLSPQVLPRLKPSQESAGDPGIQTAPVQIDRILVIGNTVLADSDIATTVDPFRNRGLQSENIQELRRRLSVLYFNAGYINSGVLIPEQDFTSGTLKLQVVEGELQEIQMLGNEHLTTEYLEGRIRRTIKSPLNLNDLQDSLRLLELNPIIRQVNGVLVPGLSPGEADLQLRIKEERPLRIAFSVDNHRSPSVGAERGILSIEHLNLTGHGDSLSAAISASEGLKDAYLSYQLPINSYDSRLILEYQRGDSTVIESTFDDLDIEGDSESWGVMLSHPFIENLSRKFLVSFGLNHSSNETSLLDEPFSFSLGAREGRSATTSVGLGAQWIERGDNQVLALRTTVRYGIDAFNATTIPREAGKVQLSTGAEIPDSRFTALMTQFQYARRIEFRNSQLVFNTVWQEAFDPLLAVEKFAIGGVYSVRGFRENQLVRDNGVTASLEWRVPIFVNDTGYSKWNLTAVPFFDYGRSWDEDPNLSTHSPTTISSLGLGLVWSPIANLGLNLFYGRRIDENDIPEPADHDLQDDGLHFSVQYSQTF